MKLSIITINYNNIEGLRRTIDSVLSQTWTDFEWIVIDGGSTDGSRALIEEYASHFSYWCSERDQGIYNAMNKGIRHARGEYLSFLNSGDAYSGQDTLSTVFSKRLSSDIVYGNVQFVNDQGQMVKSWSPPPIITIAGFLNGFYVHHQASFIRRSVMLAHLYNEEFRIFADVEFFSHVLSRGATFQKVDVPVALSQLGGVSGKNNHATRMEKRRATIMGMRHLFPSWFVFAYSLIPDIPIRLKWSLVRMLAAFSARRDVVDSRRDLFE